MVNWAIMTVYHCFSWPSRWLWLLCLQTPVMFNMYSTSRNSQHFADPLSFKPERWSRDEPTELNPFSSLPFGFGPRSCYGEFGEKFTWLALIWQTHKWIYEIEWGGEGGSCWKVYYICFACWLELTSDAWINFGTSCRSEASRTWNPCAVDPSKSTLSVAVKHQCMAMQLTLSPARDIVINASLLSSLLYNM